MKRKYSLKERRTLILKTLNESGKIYVTDLMKFFDISEVSVRKDLAELEEKQLLIRVKGGAINIHQNTDIDDLSIANKELKHAKEKMLIGQFAASLIKENETIILDSGTTTMEVAKNIGSFNKLTVITNALNIALYLTHYDRISVIVLGGQMRSLSESTVGMIAETALNNYYCDKLFLGVDSISLEKGMSTPNIEEASLNQTMIACAKEVIAVFDSSKFERRSLAFISGIEKLDAIVTDSGISDEEKEYMETRGIKVYVADVDKE